MAKQYAVVVQRDPETGQWWVSVPALPGCYTQGDTKEEALANAEEAIAGHIAALESLGEPIPNDVMSPELHTVRVVA